jgi:catechol-2,3-dioxygenase
MYLSATNLDVAQTFYQSLGFSLTAKWGHFVFFPTTAITTISESIWQAATMLDSPAFRFNATP